ncbi:MAG: leucyl aminopeptidase [Pseudomonadota bacterium]
MTAPLAISFADQDLDAIAEMAGKVTVLMTQDGAMDVAARRVNRLTKGALKRLSEDEAWGGLGAGKGYVINLPTGMAATALQVIKLEKRVDALVARKAGAQIAAFKGKDPVTVLAAGHAQAHELAYGMALRAYGFEAYKTSETAQKPMEAATIVVTDPEGVSAKATDQAAVTEGVFFTRDLTNEPANVLTTDDFAARLAAMQDLGLDVTILEEPELEELGMRTLLGVGQGSRSPSKVVVMKWNGGGDEAPFALVGKGVVFDTGGISLKPAGGMEDMTMDMGGAGVVSGVMRALALRKAKANVVGLVGLVENMPDGNAQRPGDVVKSMKGDTIEVINTDAEGRLVLADVLWYAQQEFKPTGIVDLATLTGAIIIGLGHHKAGVFSNDDDLCTAFLKAADAEDEGAWRMPLGAEYDKQIDSRIADMANVGGRAAGSVTAAQFLQRFVQKGTPWIHLDIAGVASVKSATTFAPKGATGWGVRALDRLIRDRFES